MICCDKPGYDSDDNDGSADLFTPSLKVHPDTSTFRARNPSHLETAAAATAAVSRSDASQPPQCMRTACSAVVTEASNASCWLQQSIEAAVVLPSAVMGLHLALHSKGVRLGPARHAARDALLTAMPRG